LKARYLRPARRELHEAIEYYEQQRPGLGREFRDEVYATVDRIKALPAAWRPMSPNTRRCPTRRFPYGVIYAVERDELVIIAIAHAHRDPNYWKDRI
jgi:plasmid stabilization system protein ParE